MEFRCKVDANPFVASTIQWKLPLRPQDPGRKWQDRSQIVVEDGVSILRLSGIERTDMGEVICEASNGVKNVKKTAMTYLIVNRKCAQCGNYWIFLSLRFYVKSILQLPEVQKLPFLQI